MSRGEIAKVTETSYQVVYGLTRAPKEGVVAEGDEDGEGDGDEENIL
jgi:stress response protein SCP2